LVRIAEGGIAEGCDKIEKTGKKTCPGYCNPGQVDKYLH
jgi:hypothetical protein